jgi:hypothetical protein
MMEIYSRISRENGTFYTMLKNKKRQKIITEFPDKKSPFFPKSVKKLNLDHQLKIEETC